MRKPVVAAVFFIVVICISYAEPVKKIKNKQKTRPSNFEKFVRTQNAFSSRSASGDHYTEVEKIIDRSKEVACNITENFIFNRIDQSDLSCSPRKLIRPVTGLIIHHKLMYLYPSHVQVNWCTGSCVADFHSQKTCVPDQIKVSSIPITAVIGTSPKNTESKCFVAEIQEHISCKCDCHIEKQHCDPVKMNYDRRRCRCECKNSVQQLTCEHRGKLWDPVKCECLCMIAMPCSTGYLFDPETCKCVRIARRNAQQQAIWREKLTTPSKKNLKATTKPPRR